MFDPSADVVEIRSSLIYLKQSTFARHPFDAISLAHIFSRDINSAQATDISAPHTPLPVAAETKWAG